MDKKNILEGKMPIEIRFSINGIEYIGKIPEKGVHRIKTEIEKCGGSIGILNNEILKEIKKQHSFLEKKYRGRRAAWIASQFNMNETTVYQALKVLRDAPPDIIKKVRSGKMPFKTAYKLITNKNLEEPTNNE